MRVVGHREDVQRGADRRVEAGRRAGHLGDRAGIDDPGAERAGLAVGPTDHDRQPRPARPTRAATRLEQPAEDRARGEDRREQARIEVQVGHELAVPARAAEVEHERRGGMGPVGRRDPGEGQPDEIARLERQRRPGRIVRARARAARAASGRYGSPTGDGRSGRGWPRRRTARGAPPPRPWPGCRDRSARPRRARRAGQRGPPTGIGRSARSPGPPRARRGRRPPCDRRGRRAPRSPPSARSGRPARPSPACGERVG